MVWTRTRRSTWSLETYYSTISVCVLFYCNFVATVLIADQGREKASEVIYRIASLIRCPRTRSHTHTCRHNAQDVLGYLSVPLSSYCLLPFSSPFSIPSFSLSITFLETYHIQYMSSFSKFFHVSDVRSPVDCFAVCRRFLWMCSCAQVSLHPHQKLCCSFRDATTQPGLSEGHLDWWEFVCHSL